MPRPSPPAASASLGARRPGRDASLDGPDGQSGTGRDAELSHGGTQLSATATITVRNTGTAPAKLGITSRPGGFTLAGPRDRAGRAGPAAGGAPLQRIRGHFSPHAIGRPLTRAGRLAAAPPSTHWLTTAYYPVNAANLAAAADPVTGRVYAVGDGSGGYVFDPATGRWSALPSEGYSRYANVAGFINGKLYVAGGYSSYDRDPVTGLEIYDPASGLWTAGAPIPNPYFGAASAVLNGKMYVVGGCNASLQSCGENDVQVYDPATNTWSSAAPYPIGTSWLGCGAIGDLLYCAGGVSDVGGTTAAAYSYNPRTNTWSPIESLPIDLWGSAASAADGELLLSGGVTANGTVLTNQGYAYNPVTRAWTALPNARVASYRGSGVCGFYRIGGIVGVTISGTEVLSANVEQLAGYGDCGGDPWLSASPATTTLAPGQSTKITVTLDAANPSVNQPGTYTAGLQLDSDTPYPTLTVPVTLTATPRTTWGKITGTVSGLSCAGTAAPLPGATVQVTSADAAWPLTTDRRGQYALWLDSSNDPLTLIVSAPGWQSQAATVKIKALATTVRNFTLTQSENCG